MYSVDLIDWLIDWLFVLEVDGKRIRVDYSITKRAHTPTPGVYVGRPAAAYQRRDGEYR